MTKEMIAQLNKVQEYLVDQMSIATITEGHGAEWFREMSQAVLNIEQAKKYEPNSNSICNWGTIAVPSELPIAQTTLLSEKGKGCTKFVKNGETVWTSSGTSVTSSPQESS